jgi:hypothetical protein
MATHLGKGFTIGDRVHYSSFRAGASSSGGYLPGPLNGTGTVFDDTDFHSIGVEFIGWHGGHAGKWHDNRKNCWYVDGAKLEQVPFIVGDRVSIKADYDDFADGATGVITEHDGTPCMPWWVHLDESEDVETDCFDAHELERIIGIEDASYLPLKPFQEPTGTQHRLPECYVVVDALRTSYATYGEALHHAHAVIAKEPIRIYRLITELTVKPVVTVTTDLD